jgi:hypothetical protein
MLSWPNLRWSVYWWWYVWKISRPIWWTMWIGTDVKGCCHDQIWGYMWNGTDDKGWCPDLIWCSMLIGTDDKRCSHDLIWSATLIRKDVSERFDDQLEWICDWNSCEKMQSWPNLRCYVDWKGCERKILRQIWGTMWIRTDVKGCCHDKIRGLMWKGTDDKGCSLDSVGGAMWIGKSVEGSFKDQFLIQCGLEQLRLDSLMT